jgi:hypothetical protein
MVADGGEVHGIDFYQKYEGWRAFGCVEDFGFKECFLSSFFRKKKQKIAPVEALAEFLTQKPSENQAAASLLPARAPWLSSARKGRRGFFHEEFPCENYFLCDLDFGAGPPNLQMPHFFP